MADRSPNFTVEEINRRERSTIEFPYLDLQNAIEIATAVQMVGGSACQKDQLAAHLNQSATSGGFNLRLATAKMFGLLTYDAGTISLTNSGMQLSDPLKAASIKSEAFLTVPLYKAIYEKYKGLTLPQVAELETEMARLGVAPKQKEKARQVFQRSAKQAGYFNYGADKLIQPANLFKTPLANQSRLDDIEAPGRFKPDNEIGGSHPFITGLFRTLPEAGTRWSVEDRKKWLQTAENIFGLIFKD